MGTQPASKGRTPHSSVGRQAALGRGGDTKQGWGWAVFCNQRSSQKTRPRASRPPWGSARLLFFRVIWCIVFSSPYLPCPFSFQAVLELKPFWLDTRRAAGSPGVACRRFLCRMKTSAVFSWGLRRVLLQLSSLRASKFPASAGLNLWFGCPRDPPGREGEGLCLGMCVNGGHETPPPSTQLCTFPGLVSGPRSPAPRADRGESEGLSKAPPGPVLVKQTPGMAAESRRVYKKSPVAAPGGGQHVGTLREGGRAAPPPYNYAGSPSGLVKSCSTPNYQQFSAAGQDKGTHPSPCPQ